jgi:hypothetical protein
MQNEPSSTPEPLSDEEIDFLETWLHNEGGVMSSWPWPTIHRVLVASRRLAAAEAERDRLKEQLEKLLGNPRCTDEQGNSERKEQKMSRMTDFDRRHPIDFVKRHQGRGRNAEDETSGSSRGARSSVVTDSHASHSRSQDVPRQSRESLSSAEVPVTE